MKTEELKITARDGLLWRGDKVIPLPEADTVAKQHGFTCAEQMVKEWEGNLELVPELPPDLRVSIAAEDPAFEELMATRRKLLGEVERFDPVESVDDTPRMEDAKRLRLKIVKNRTALDGIREKVGKVFYNRWKSINELFKPLIRENDSAEDWLRESEEFAIRAEASRKAEIRQERLGLWRKEGFLEELLNGVDVAELTEAQWNVFWRTGAEDKKDRQEKAEAAQKQAEADRLERERLAAENNKLKADKEALEQQEHERVAAEARKAEEEKKLAAKAKRAPDKTKLESCHGTLQDWLDGVRKLPCKTDEGKAVSHWLVSESTRLISELAKRINSL